MSHVPPNRFEKYGTWWLKTAHPLSIEIDCIRKGGLWKMKNGQTAGAGLFHHFKRFQQICWPDVAFHRWADLELESYLTHTYIGEMGCAAAGKSDNSGRFVLADWYCFAAQTTVLVSSTTLESLDLRVWGMIKKYHREAKRRFAWLPGNLIEGRRVIGTRSPAGVRRGQRLQERADCCSVQEGKLICRTWLLRRHPQ